MTDKDLGADATAVERAGASDTPQLSHAAHTPGPWRVFEINSDPRIVAADGFPVAVAEETGVLPEWDRKLKIRHWADGDEGVSHVHRSDDEVFANAHLIAAAPEMYEALRDRVWAEHDDATHWPANSTRYGHAGDFGTCPHQDCRIIAKAEGRS